jgi:hypothetical protein
VWKLVESGGVPPCGGCPESLRYERWLFTNYQTKTIKIKILVSYGISVNGKTFLISDIDVIFTFSHRRITLHFRKLVELEKFLSSLGIPMPPLFSTKQS